MVDVEEYIGKKFGRLTIIEFSHKKQRYSSNGNKAGHEFYYKCKCDCGNETVSRIADLKSGKASSCGCYRLERTKEVNRKYETAEFWNTKLYKVYSKMKDRCFNINNKRYADYGGRDITVCADWANDYLAFYNWAMSNGYKEGLSIDRINNNGNYEPCNCRFVTSAIQNNNKRSSHYISHNGKTQTMKQWANELGISYGTLRSRLNILGWSDEKALTTLVACQTETKDYTYLIPAEEHDSEAVETPVDNTGDNIIESKEETNEENSAVEEVTEENLVVEEGI